MKRRIFIFSSLSSLLSISTATICGSRIIEELARIHFEKDHNTPKNLHSHLAMSGIGRRWKRGDKQAKRVSN
ncbi:hypothetical protein SADUNF_Sadunf14G0058200 [Salix dunnii]|uniref:Secreted protein n=1 Tax=Salix dunnii TaxID=1413687 RepID=A0A835JI87_9ROSI|nr:hypothetical protein SADUNF_Sadunf14G0058200 [Salix dunnii]